MRFDTKMVQMLFQGPSTYQRPNSRGQYNKFGKNCVSFVTEGILKSEKTNELSGD